MNVCGYQLLCFRTKLSAFEITAHLGSAVLLIAASYSGCDRMATVTLLTLSVGA